MTPRFSALCVAAVVAVPALAQGESPDSAFKRIEELVLQIRKTAPADRSGLLDRLYAECGRFLDAHLEAASPEQLSLAGTTWLQLATREGDAKALQRRLKELTELKSLPADLARMVRIQSARLKVKVGTPAPNWTAKDVYTSKELSLADLKGKLILVCFWTTRNPSCQALMERKLAPLQTRYGQNEGFVLVGLGVPGREETIEKQAAYGKEHKIDWRLAFDSSGESLVSLGASGVPFLCLVDAGGKILALGPGWQVIGDVTRLVEEGLGTRSVSPSEGGENRPG